MTTTQKSTTNKSVAWLKRGTVVLIGINGISLLGYVFSLYTAFKPVKEEAVPYLDSALLQAQSSWYNRISIMLLFVMTLALLLLYIDANQRLKEEDLPSAFVYWADLIVCVLIFFNAWHFNVNYGALSGWAALSSPVINGVVSLLFLGGMLYFRRQAQTVLTYDLPEDEQVLKRWLNQVKQFVRPKKRVAHSGQTMTRRSKAKGIKRGQK